MSNIPGYVGMGIERAQKAVEHLHKLWPRWSSTPELNTEWACLLRDHPAEVVDAVIRAHLRERVGSPAMQGVHALLTAAKRQHIESGRGVAPKAHGGSTTAHDGHLRSISEWSRWHVENPGAWLDGQRVAYPAIAATVERHAASQYLVKAGMCVDARRAWMRWEAERRDLDGTRRVARLRELAEAARTATAALMRSGKQGPTP